MGGSNGTGNIKLKNHSSPTVRAKGVLDVLYVWVQILRLKFRATISGNPSHKISHKYVHSVVHRMYYGIDTFKIFVAWLDLEIYCTFGFKSCAGPRNHPDSTKIRSLIESSTQVDHHTSFRFVLTPIFEGDMASCFLALFGPFLTPDRPPHTTHQISSPRLAKKFEPRFNSFPRAFPARACARVSNFKKTKQSVSLILHFVAGYQPSPSVPRTRSADLHGPRPPRFSSPRPPHAQCPERSSGEDPPGSGDGTGPRRPAAGRWGRARAVPSEDRAERGRAVPPEDGDGRARGVPRSGGEPPSEPAGACAGTRGRSPAPPDVRGRMPPRRPSGPSRACAARIPEGCSGPRSPEWMRAPYRTRSTRTAGRRGG